MVRAGASHLDLRKNSLGDAGVAEMSAAIKYSNSLVHLDLSSNELGPKAGKELFKALAVNESITSVDVSSHEGLHRNRLCAKGMKHIVQLLRTSKILTILNLSGNAIRAEGLAFVAEGLTGNTTLLSLRVAQNEIQPLCYAVLRTILVESRICELDLSDNPLGNQCVETVAQTLGSRSLSLRRLYLAGVGVTGILSASLTHIGSCTNLLFTGSRSLQTLRLDRNNLAGPAFVESISILLSSGTPLQNLSLNECSVGDSGGEALFLAAARSASVRSLSLQKNSLSVSIQKLITSRT